MKHIRNFVKNTFKNYPKEERDQLIQSITEMLIEKVQDLMDKGLSEQEATDKAIMEFGTIEDYEDKPKKIKRKLVIDKTIRHYRNDVMFSAGGSLIIIGILLYIDFTYTPTIRWSLIPSFALLFWPLATIYRLFNKKASERGEKDE
jgi:hypothetical protein